MATIANFPRVCFQTCIVKDNFLVSGTSEFRKEVVFNGKVIFSPKGSVCFQGPFLADEINEFTPDHGVIVDGVLLKDGSVCATSVTTDAINEKTPNNGVVVDGVLLKDLNVTGNVLCANISVQTNTIVEKTLNTGVTVDGVLLKDSEVCASELQVDTIVRKTESSPVVLDGDICVTGEVLTNFVSGKSEGDTVCFNSPIQVDYIGAKTSGVCIENNFAVKIGLAPTVVTNGVVYPIYLDSALWGNFSMFTPPVEGSSGTVVIPKSGIYCVAGQITWDVAAGNWRKLYLDSSVKGPGFHTSCVQNVNGAPTSQPVSVIDYFEQGEILSMSAEHDQGAPVGTIPFPTPGCFNVYYLHEGAPVL